MEWNSTCEIAGLEFHIRNGIPHGKGYILPHVIIVPHANIPHVQFQYSCVGGPVESMCGHSMEPNSSRGDGDLEFHSWSLLHFFLSIPYVHVCCSKECIIGESVDSLCRDDTDAPIA